MKRYASLFLALAIVLTLAPGRAAGEFYTGSGTGDNGMISPNGSVGLIPGDGGQESSGIGISPIVPDNNQNTWNDPWNQATEAAPAAPVVTKSPTAETVKEGEFAYFVARADNCSDIIWHLISPGNTDIPCADAASFFPGLQVEGLNTQTLTLRNIPLNLDNWKIRAVFVGWNNQTTNSEDAIIHVLKSQVTAPVIAEHPMSVSLEASQGTTLRATATTDVGNTLSYQWYKSSFNLNSGGQAIPGATSNVYSPDYAEGTTYYYCVITCSDGTLTSEPSKTNCAAVTYAPLPTQPTTAPTQATQPTVAPTQPVETTEATVPKETVAWGSQTTATEPERMPTTTAKSSGNGFLMVIVGIILFIAVLGIIATVLILKFYPSDEEDDDEYDKPMPKKPSGRSFEKAKHDYVSRPVAPRAPAAPQKKTTADKYAAPTSDDGWDDLSDLGDLSIYFDDENQQ